MLTRYGTRRRSLWTNGPFQMLSRLPARLNFHGIVHAYEAGSGKLLRGVRLRSLDDVGARIEQLQK